MRGSNGRVSKEDVNAVSISLVALDSPEETHRRAHTIITVIPQY